MNRSLANVKRATAAFKGRSGGTSGARSGSPKRPRVAPYREVLREIATSRSFERAELPSFVPPQLATRVASVPSGDQWLHEIKYDGYRLLARKDGSRVQLLTRRGLDWSSKLPALCESLRALPAKSIFADGELTVLEADGRTSFHKLQNLAENSDNARYYLFDLLHLDGIDLRQAPLLERKQLLETVLQAVRDPLLQYSGHQVGNGENFYRAAEKLRLEGIICKDMTSRYVSARSKTWLKVKCSERQEFVIGGYTLLKGVQQSIGALLLGVYDEEGKLRYCGKVGTGFSSADRTTLQKALQRRKRKAPGFANPPRERDAVWSEPSLVAEIAFHEWTADGRLRQPVFQGLRDDKNPRTIRRERPQDA